MKNIIVALCLVVSTQVQAQVEGYWYGAANIKNNAANNYLVEMIIKQKGTNVEAVVNYYFRKTFRSIKTTGIFNAADRRLTLLGIPVTYHGSTDRMEVDCPMDLFAQLRTARAGSNLQGSFVTKGTYKNTCPEIFFDMKLNKDAGNQDSILTALRLFKETYQVWTPAATDTAVAATIIQRPVTNYVVTDQYKQREKEYVEDIEVSSDSLQIDFYDNGEIDGDSISIFFNEKLLASSQKLSSSAIHLNIALDTSRQFNELSMFADNLGSIPPNTALMLVYDGTRRYELRVSSNLQKNATVRIRRKKKTP